MEDYESSPNVPLSEKPARQDFTREESAKSRRISSLNDLDLRRWREYEDILTDSLWLIPELDRFQLLTRQHNLWKSRYCERCAETGTRGIFIGIEFFYEGGPTWPRDIPDDDEQGCYGCFWYNPQKWRQSLNELVAQHQK